MQDPLVSVHMLAYNHEAYIRRAIDGALAQRTRFPFELVIGEDCSTDGTWQIVFEYQKRHPDVIRVVSSDENVGMIENERRTNAACRGKYIAYCEGDDYWQRDDKLQVQADYLERHPECGLVHSDQDRYYVETGKKIKNFFRSTNNLPPEPLNVFRGWGAYNILTCTVMARRALIDSIVSESRLFQNNQHVGALDIPLFIEISMRSDVHYMDDSLATYTVLTESASNTRDLGKKARFVTSNIEAYLYLAEKYGQEEDAAYFRKLLPRMRLWVAFWDKNNRLAEEVRRKGKRLSLKAWMLYAGTVNAAARFVLHPILTALQTRKNSATHGLQQYFTE